MKLIPKHKDVTKTPYKEKQMAQKGKEAAALEIMEDDPSKSNLQVAREMQAKGISVNDLYVTHRIGRSRLFKMSVDEVRTHYKRILDKELMPQAIENIKAALLDETLPKTTKFQYEQMIFKQAMDDSGKDRVQPVTVNIENIQTAIESQLNGHRRNREDNAGAKRQEEDGEAQEA